MKSVIIAIAVFSLVGCKTFCRGKDYVDVATSKEITNYTQKLYEAKVAVWVRNCGGSPITLEYIKYCHDCTSENADIFIQNHLVEANALKEKIDSFINQQ